MPKRIPQEELAAIVAMVQKHPDGAGIDAIRKGLDFDLSDRTLQRRLNLLEREDRIVSEGRGTGKRYFPIPADREAETKVATEVFSLDGIKLSEESLELRRQMSQPLAARVPVGYNKEFLNHYRPNETHYLPQDLREKLAHLGRPEGGELVAGTHLQQIFHRLLIDLSWNSSRLEGNTYSLLDTERLLEVGQEAEGKNAEETQMILNHKAAIELLVDTSVEIGFNRYTICNLHALLSQNLLREPAACGRIRSRGVAIQGSVFQPLNIPQAIEENFDLFLEKCSLIVDPFEQAFFSMVHLPYLQPFEDVNKRVSRLAANLPLIREDYCPLSYVDMPTDDYTKAMLAVYETNSVEYLREVFAWVYERSARRYSLVRQELGEPDPFRLKYRLRIQEVVSSVVKEKLSRANAPTRIKEHSQGVPPEDRAHFIEVVETELMHLHEGNIARYKLKPSEYELWREGWK